MKIFAPQTMSAASGTIIMYDHEQQTEAGQLAIPGDLVTVGDSW